MSLLTNKEENRDLEERLKYGHRLNGCGFSGGNRAKSYNAVNGTNFFDDEALDRFLANRTGIT